MNDYLRGGIALLDLATYLILQLAFIYSEVCSGSWLPCEGLVSLRGVS